MISGSKMRPDQWLKRWLRALVAVALLGTGTAWAFDLTELMGLLAQKKSGEARFTEQRFVRGLDGPISAAGTLSFQAPDKLTRETTLPRPESMAVDGNQLTLSRGGRTRTLTLDSMPEMLGMVEAMRGTLSGDAGTLQRYFKSKLGGSREGWTLDLAPTDERLAAQVDGVRLTGRAGEVLGVEMTFRGGDRSVMTIVPGAAPTAKPAAARAPS